MLGAIIIVLGLYLVVWGKSKDHITSSTEVDEKKTMADLPTTINNTDKTKSNENYALNGISILELPAKILPQP